MRVGSEWAEQSSISKFNFPAFIIDEIIDLKLMNRLQQQQKKLAQLVIMILSALVELMGDICGTSHGNRINLFSITS